LGEEVREPRRTIPRAIILTLAACGALYVGVAAVGISTIGAEAMAGAAQTEVAPLLVAARSFVVPGALVLVTVGALTATLGVLLNLILGLSRVLLAMGRHGDAPRWLAAINRAGSPVPAVFVAGAAIGALALLGNVKTAWSFSAFTVLVYYAITNLAALRLPKDKRLYPPAIAWAGLAACLFLAFWVEQEIWLVGLALIAAGLAWHALSRRIFTPADTARAETR
jgi:APA family basic amino acid/polyamine antiporter